MGFQYFGISVFSICIFLAILPPPIPPLFPIFGPPATQSRPTRQRFEFPQMLRWAQSFFLVWYRKPLHSADIIFWTRCKWKFPPLKKFGLSAPSSWYESCYFVAEPQEKKAAYWFHPGILLPVTAFLLGKKGARGPLPAHYCMRMWFTTVGGVAEPHHKALSPTQTWLTSLKNDIEKGLRLRS